MKRQYQTVLALDSVLTRSRLTFCVAGTKAEHLEGRYGNHPVIIDTRAHSLLDEARGPKGMFSGRACTFWRDI